MEKDDIGFFDPDAAFSIVSRGLPHWSQPGTICFVTWRLADSLPQAVLEKLDAEVAQILLAENLRLTRQWKLELAKRSAEQRGKVQWKLFSVRDKFLDAGHGSCLLAKRQHAEEVLKSLRHFDGDKYFLTDAVVMPNHVHFLVAFDSEEAMLAQCESWKRFTGRAINAAENRTGAFWQVDQFDHLIRSPEHWEHYRRYIRENPIKAGLAPERFVHFSKKLT